MEFQKPVVVYTAASNFQAHLIVDILLSKDIPAYVVEDQTGVSLWVFGTNSAFHQPQIFVDEADQKRAALVILEFEANQRKRAEPENTSTEIEAVCEKCKKVTIFPGSLNGTTQDCSHCGAYIDVGDFGFEGDFGTPED